MEHRGNHASCRGCNGAGSGGVFVPLEAMHPSVAE